MSSLKIGKRWKYLLLCPKLPDFRKSIAFWKVSRLRPFVLSVKATRRRSVRGIGGITSTRETGSTQRKTFSNATLSTTNPTCSGLGSSPGLLRQTPATNRLSHGNALKIETHLNNMKKFSFYRAENTWPLSESF
jgi:hypothetical protein